MIIANTLQISDLLDKIIVSVSTGTGSQFTKLLFWTAETYKDYDLAIDLTHLMSLNSDSEDFEITLADVDLESFSGLFYLEFYSNEETVPGDCFTDGNVALYPVANFAELYECILDKVLGFEIGDCDKLSSDIGAANCGTNFLTLNTLLTTLESAVQTGFYEEANTILGTLQDSCSGGCGNCPSMPDVLVINGTSLGVINNKVTKV